MFILANAAQVGLRKHSAALETDCKADWYTVGAGNGLNFLHKTTFSLVKARNVKFHTTENVYIYFLNY